MKNVEFLYLKKDRYHREQGRQIEEHEARLISMSQAPLVKNNPHQIPIHERGSKSDKFKQIHTV